MKMRQPHVVPLAHQAVEVLRELHPVTRNDRYASPCHGKKGRPMSAVAVLAALRVMGFDKDTVTRAGSARQRAHC